LTSFLKKLWQQAWSLILVEMSVQEVGWLMRPHGHISLLANRRTTIIVTRARLSAGLFAALTPLWIIFDIFTFPPEIWEGLVLARVAATAGFIGILLMLRRMETIRDAYRALGLLMTVPMAFFLFTYLHMSQFQLHGVQAALSTGYAFLPFVVVAGLSIFPLTLVESLSFSLPVLLMQLAAAALHSPALDWATIAAAFWLLALISGVSAMAGLSQLAFMIVLVREAIRDSMTGCYSRNSGEELLELQFILSTRNATPLSLVFMDLDHFKQINDRFGHDAGDNVLVSTSAAIRSELRTGDILIRWGGEEFVLILPNNTGLQACQALERLRKSGLGLRPDGTPVTASIGVAERITDNAQTWQDLVEKADTRMYQAKQGGRNRVIASDTPAA
jgi:diguanylate cyclase (GGDEF)-like protein